jgi:bifunctional non-homologous end joining protein LigD
MADALTRYKSMRDFSSTPEPKGRVRKTVGHTYIIQKHDATRLHYDFRLELDGVLLSWAVTRGPSLNPADKRLAVRTEDHPVDYAGFEGVIPKGYGAGTVMLWDRGEWAPQEDPHAGLKKGSLKIVLNGERLKGGFALVRLKPKPGEKAGRENWLLIKERDEWATDDVTVTEEWTDSVKTGRDLAAISSEGDSYKRGTTYRPGATEAKTDQSEKKPSRKPKSVALRRRTPTFIAPQLATLQDAPPQGAGWLHEIKFDGYRIVAVIHRGRVHLFTRNRKDWTHKYARIAGAIAKLGLKDAVFDGELVATNAKGEADFSRMQAAGEDDSVPLTYHVFDLLNLDGEDTSVQPLVDRKRLLASLLETAPDAVKYSDHIEGDGDRVIASACGLKLEGVISKKADAPYRSGRTLDWIKSKCIGSDEFVVAGFRKSDKRGRPFSSLLLGEHVDGNLLYRGRVGTGFDEKDFETLSAKFARRRRKTSPFAETPAEARQGAVWLTPDIVVQVSYLEETPDGRLRHPSYLGLREDKPAADVQAKRAAHATSSRARRALSKAGTLMKKPADGKDGDARVMGVRLSSPDKVLWPETGATKLTLAEHYAAHADHILPYLKDRPLSLVRCPEGRDGQRFFQKHRGDSTPDEIATVDIVEKNGDKSPYLMIRDAPGLVAAAQISALELHIWGARSDRIDSPERIVFDLDPDEGLAFTDVREAAVEVRDVLASVGLDSFAMLTGGKGVHVVAPIVRRREWDEIKPFARSFAETLAKTSPDRYVAQASKAKREGRIFIDWLRNERGSTAVAPYSPRAREGAPVATPVTWDELKRSDTAARYMLATIGKRLASLRADPWEGYFDTRQSITADMIRAFG